MKLPANGNGEAALRISCLRIMADLDDGGKGRGVDDLEVESMLAKEAQSVSPCTRGKNVRLVLAFPLKSSSGLLDCNVEWM